MGAPFFEKHLLDCGMPAYIEHYAGLPWTKALITINVGHCDDPIGKEATAHVLEHHVSSCMERKFMGPNDVDLKLWSLERGIELTLGNTKQYDTRYSVRSNHSEFFKGLSILSSIVFSPDLGRTPLEYDIAIVDEERTERFPSNSSLKRNRQLYSSLFPNSRIATATGLPETDILRSITLDDIQQMHNSHYHCGNAFLVIATGMPTDQVVSQCNQIFLGNGDVKPPRPRPPDWIPVPKLEVNKLFSSASDPEKSTHALIEAYYVVPDHENIAVSNLCNSIREEIYCQLRKSQGQTYHVAGEMQGDTGYSFLSFKTQVRKEISKQVGDQIISIAGDPKIATARFEGVRMRTLHSMGFERPSAERESDRVRNSLVYRGYCTTREERMQEHKDLRLQRVLNLQQKYMTEDAVWIKITELM